MGSLLEAAESVRAEGVRIVASSRFCTEALASERPGGRGVCEGLVGGGCLGAAEQQWKTCSRITLACSI